MTDLIAELADLLKEAGVTPRLYGQPVDLVALGEDMREELANAPAFEPLAVTTQRAVERHLDTVRADRRALVAALGCDHSGMRECHPGCGHLVCTGCGLAWDEGAEK